MADDDTDRKQTVCLVRDFDQKKIQDGWKNIEVVQALVPVPGNGQYLIKMQLRPIDPTDLIAASGDYGEELHKLPLVNGTEGVGKIEATGPGSGYKFKVGQRVVAGNWIDGTWQEYLVVDEDVLMAVPDQLDDVAASQFLVNPCTAVGLLEVADVPKGDWLLQSAASSTLGRQIIALAKELGVKTINQVHRDTYVQELKDLGADLVVNTAKEDLVQRSREVTKGRGAYTSLDPVAGTFTEIVVKATRKFGRTILYGELEDNKVTVHVMDLVLHGRVLDSFILYNFLPSGGRDKMQERMQRTMDLLVKGVLKTAPPHKTFPLKEVHAAIAEHQKPGHGGRKVFLK